MALSQRALGAVLTLDDPAARAASVAFLARSGEVMAALYLAPLAFAGDDVAAVAVDALLAGARPIELLQLAGAVRQPWTWSGPAPPPLGVRPERLAPLDPGAPGDAARLAMASLDRDGYVREAATRRLARSAAPYARRLLWVRLDDAVPPVASLADAELARRPLDVNELVADLPLLEALAARERARAAPSLRRALGLLTTPTPGLLEALRRGLDARDPALRAACARRLADVTDDPEARARALLEALANSETRVHRWAAKEAVSRRTSPAVTALVAPAMVAHRNAEVRLLGLRWAAAHGDAFDALLAATMDPNAAVRLEARVLLHRGGGADHRSLALEALREGAPGAWPDAARALGALGAIGDVGERDDWPLAARFLEHPRATVRAAALRALGYLAPELFADVFVARVRDTSGRVACEAVGGLRRCALSMGDEAFRARVPDDALAALALDGELRWPCRAAVLGLLAALPGERGAVFLRRVAGERRGPARELALALLRQMAGG